jgi:hypothetical protein
VTWRAISVIGPWATITQAGNIKDKSVIFIKIEVLAPLRIDHAATTTIGITGIQSTGVVVVTILNSFAFTEAINTMIA